MTADYRFIVDLNVGRLAKWIRAMGYDALFPRDANDNDLVRIALKENRVLLTRDAGIILRRAVRQGQLHVVHIEDDDLWSQLRQLVRDLNLDVRSGFTSCVRCNEPLKPVLKQEVDGRVPPYVFQTHQSFMECAQGGRLYWRGSYWAGMTPKLDQVYQEAS